MRIRAMGMLPLAVGAIAGSAVAQNPPAQTARTVVAATKLPTVTDAPMYFTVASVELVGWKPHPPALVAGAPGSNGQ
jgi:hypothetical protein